MMIKNIIHSIFIYLLTTTLVLAQTASILPQGKTQFTDQNGKPLTSGTVDFYVPTTTTRKTTWQDSGETIPNSNPVVLDGSGRAIIWGDGTYRQVVKDRNGNLIWDAITSSIGSGGGGGGSTVGDGDAVGTIKPYSGITPPDQYQFTYGQALSRTTYVALFSAITKITSVTCVGGSPTLTNISDTSYLPIGGTLESICVSGAPTIISKTTNSVTLSANATISTSTTATFFPYGNGDGVNTFNVPDLRGYVLAGRNNMGGVSSSTLNSTYFSSNANNVPNAINAKGGNQSLTLLNANLPQHTHTSPTLTDPGHSHSYNTLGSPSRQDGTQVLSVITSTSGATTSVNTTGITLSASTGVNASGTSTPLSLLQPTVTMNYIIKVTPDSASSSVTVVQSLGGMSGVITCSTIILCAGNDISVNLNNLLFTQNGANAVARSYQNKLTESFSVKDFGALGDGTTDDTTSINNTILAAISAGGKEVRFPASTGCYLTSSTLSIDLSAITTRFQGKLHLTGDGQSRSCIQNNSGGTIIKYLGNVSSLESDFIVKGLRIIGNSTVGSIGLQVQKAAYFSMSDVAIEILDLGFDATDVDQSLFINSQIRFNVGGMRFNPASSVTSANSMTFVSMTVANNSIYGVQAVNPNAWAWYGGSIQYNGTTACGGTPANCYGIILSDAGDGYGNILFSGMAFEGNGGQADLWSVQNSNKVNLTLNNVSFARTAGFAGIGFGVNQVLISGSALDTNYRIINSNFYGYAPYVASAGRPAIVNSNTNARLEIDGLTKFWSNTEAPSTSTIYTGYTGSRTGSITFQGVTSGTGALSTDATTTNLSWKGSPFTAIAFTAPATGITTWLATPSSANLRGALTDETGTGLAYFQGGDIGTPSAGVGTNLTALNASNLGSGTVAAARMPALTGDCTSTVGTIATTCTKSQGNAISQMSINLGSISFNTTNTDTTITVPTGPNNAFTLTAVNIYNCTAAITTATFQVWTAAGGTGNSLTALTTGTNTAQGPNVAASVQTLSPTFTGWLNQASIFFRNVVPQGSAVTCSVSARVNYL
jgi:microcystin-dependent protein